jgi:hydrogenase assembly chaperone HypC/HupF
MCLSIPGRVVETFRDGEILMAKVAFGGIVKDVCLEHVPDAAPGEYVLVHEAKLPIEVYIARGRVTVVARSPM